jgi:glycosyltransferase involved in cell wall biosynthesis
VEADRRSRLGTTRSTFTRSPGGERRRKVPQRELLPHLADAEALVIPYKINTFSKETFPAKIFECLATGKPTVATLLVDLAPLGELFVSAKGCSELVSALQRLPDLKTEAHIETMVQFARKNSQEARFKAIEEVRCGEP